MKHDTTVVQTQRTQTEAAYTAAASTENTAVFQTLSDLKQSTFLQAGDVVETAGYYELGDGGGARYEIVSNTTADGYLTHSLSNGLTAQMIIQDNRVNVRQLGAKGDGVTDDTAAINAATKSGIRHVYVPAGTYLVTPTLTDYPYWVSNPKYKNRRACIYLDENLSSFCGDGISHTIIKVTPQTQRYFSVICPLGVMNGLEIGYLTIDQNVDNCPIAPEVLGGTQDEWDEGHYRDCYKLYCIHGTFYNSRIHDCKFLHMGSNAIYANGFNYRVDNNELIFDMNRSEDIDYSYSNVAYDNSALFLCGDFVYVRHNFIYTYLTPGEVYITGTQNHQVVTAMATARGAVETHASHAWTEHNTIRNYATGLNFSGNGVGYATGSFSYNHVTGASCVVNMGGDDYSLIENPSAQLEWGGIRRLKLAGNDIHISFQHHSTHPSAFAIAAEASCEDLYIYDNTIYYDRDTYEEEYAYNFVMGAAIDTISWKLRNAHIYDNTIVNAPIYGIEISRNVQNHSARGVYIHDNTLIGCGWCTAINKSDSLADSKRKFQMRAAIMTPQESGFLGNTLDEVYIENNTIIDNSEYGECAWSIQCDQSTLDQGKVTVQNNREISLSGAGFAREDFTDISKQPFDQIPVLTYEVKCPTKGTFYVGQTYVNTGEITGIARWKCTACGTIGKSLEASYQTGVIDTSKSLNLITMADANHGIQSGDKLLVTVSGTQKAVHVYLVNGEKLYVSDLVSEGTVVTGNVNIAYQQTAEFATISTNGDGSFSGNFPIPGKIPDDVNRITGYTIHGYSMKEGTITVGTQSISLPALGKWDTMTVSSSGEGTINRQSTKLELKDYSWNVISSNDETVLFGGFVDLPVADRPLDETTAPVDHLYCDAFEVRKFNDVYGSSRTDEGITLKSTGQLRLRVLKSNLASQDSQGLINYLTSIGAYIVYKSMNVTTEKISLDALTVTSGDVLLSDGYADSTMTASSNLELELEALSERVAALEAAAK